jgi:HlyD family secretion protein
MRFVRTRWFPFAAALVVGIPGAWLLARGPAKTDSRVIARVKRGEFKVIVTTSGELRALKFVQISVPPSAMMAGAFQMKIASLVPEGTIVKAGDIVAELDRSSLATRVNDVNLAVQKAQAVFEQAMLDSTLNLSKAREDMRTMELTLEEKRLAKEQSLFEAPTVRRQAEIDLEKAQRALAQAKLDYKTRTEQAQAKMREVGTDLQRQQTILQRVQDAMADFTIKAPAPGMVIYVKESSGRKRTIGSQVNPWDNQAVATLPDLTQMESITYINEIDVRKIAVGQPVLLTLDSDPTKRLAGKVTAVANVGEQRPNQDSKVFEVKVVVEQADTTLRPGMTTGNAIETYSVKDVLFIPLEAVNSEGGVPFVYRQGGRVTKQEVITGAMNENEVVIVKGLAEDERVLLTPPEDKDKLTLLRLPGSPVQPKAGGDTALGPRPIPPSATPSPVPAAPPTQAPEARKAAEQKVPLPPKKPG